MIDEHRPALHIAVRGIVMAHLRVRTAERDLHSGVYGGVALNAAHVLTQMLAQVVARPRRPPARGVARGPAAAERRGDRVLGRAAGRGGGPGRGRRARDRTGRRRRVLRAHLGGREPRRQRHGERRRAAAAHDHPVHGERAPDGARRARPERRRDRSGAGAHPARGGARRAPRSSSRSSRASPPASIAADPVLALAREAIGRAAGAQPLFVRTGGSIPILGGLAQRGIPTVLSGLRTRRRRHPRAGRELPPGEPRPRRARSARALRGPGDAAIAQIKGSDPLYAAREGVTGRPRARPPCPRARSARRSRRPT